MGCAEEFLHPPSGYRFGPGFDGAVLETLVLVGDDLVFVQHGQVSEPVAVRAGALRTVEGEEVGKGIFVDDLVELALELVREKKFPSILGADPDAAIALLEAHLQRVDQAFPVLGVEDERIDKDVEVSLFGKPSLFELDDLTILDDPEESFLLEEGGALLKRP